MQRSSRRPDSWRRSPCGLGMSAWVISSVRTVSGMEITGKRTSFDAALVIVTIMGGKVSFAGW